MRVEIFDASEDARHILDSVLSAGVAGIDGGRVALRAKLDEVANLAAATRYESIMAHSTIDHPETELAYPYDEARIGHHEAREAVRTAYEVRAT